MASTFINPWYVGQTSPVWQIFLNNDGGPEDITGLVVGNFAGTIQNVNGTDQAAVGTWTIIATSPAQVNYKVAAGDVTAKGVYNFFVKVTFPDGVRIYDPIVWTILAS